jgi:hypothetical protein
MRGIRETLPLLGETLLEEREVVNEKVAIVVDVVMFDRSL